MLVRITRIEQQQRRQLLDDPETSEFLLHAFVVPAEKIDGIASVDENILDRGVQHARQRTDRLRLQKAFLEDTRGDVVGDVRVTLT